MYKTFTHPRRGVPMAVVCRAETQDLGASESGAKASFIISTEDVARDNHTIKADGWKLDRYALNPVVLWNHGYDFEVGALPVGRALRVAVEGGKLVAEVEFTPRDLNEVGFTIGEMVRRGFLNATSVRWDPIKWVVDEARGGVDFIEQELLELSVVAVPSDAGALATARAAGIDLAPLRAHMERLLDGHLKARDFVAIPRGAAEALWGALGERRVLVEVPGLRVAESDTVIRAAETEQPEQPPVPQPAQPAPPAATEQQPAPAPRADAPACPECSKALGADDKFCAACGVEVKRAEEPAPEAGAEDEVVIDDDACPECGAVMDGDVCPECSTEDGIVLEEEDMRAVTDAITQAVTEHANNFRRDVTGRISPR